MSHQLYSNNAERQRAYRERQRAARTAAPELPQARPHRSKGPSRPARIQALEDEARRLAADYQNWRDRLPGNLAEGGTAARLEEFIAQLEEIAASIEALDPPVVGG
jgi:hypothetical protein